MSTDLRTNHDVGLISPVGVICECALCTLPDKQRAAREFARVLKPGGRVGLSDITPAPGPAGELSDLMAWVASLADARAADSYVDERVRLERSESRI